MKRQNRGQIRIIEAFLAVLIVFSSLAISSNFGVTQSTKNDNDLVSTGLQTLMELDSDGRLGEYIDNGNWTALREAFSTTLPVGACFNLTVYDEEMRQINTAVISNGGLNGQQTAFVEYVCVSQNTVFRYYIIHSQLGVTT